MDLNRIFVALDGMTDREACTFVERHPEFTHYKVGLELYLRYGRPLIQHLLTAYHIQLFLDLKLHDIPETVAKAMQSLTGLDLHFLTLHLAGGEAMAKRAVQVARDHFPHLQLLGVSYLTSLSEKERPQIFGPGEFAITTLAAKADQWGVGGLVCAATDLPQLQAIQSLKVCPGIRFAKYEDAPDDHKRVATPQTALREGADYLVLGRSLTQCLDLPNRINYLRQIE